MAKLKLTEKGLLVSKEDSIYVHREVALYVAKINRCCLPLLQELGMCCKDKRQMLRYCCKGGMKRIKKAYLEGIKEGTAIYSSVSGFFGSVVKNHPEYEECANSWRWSNLLEIGEDGLFCLNEGNFAEYNTRYIKDKKNIDFVQKMADIVELLNSLPIHEEKKFDFFRYDFSNFIMFHVEYNKFIIGEKGLEDFHLLELRQPKKSFPEECDFELSYKNDTRKEQFLQAVKELGLNKSEIEEIMNEEESKKCKYE